MTLATIGGDSADARPLAVADAGTKAANLAHLARLGLQVPPAFVVGASACRQVLQDGHLGAEQRRAIRTAIGELERITGRRFGGANPLLVSVRSSPPSSMPGMLNTVLDVGMNAEAIRALLRRTGNPVFVWDTWRRFVEGYAETVRGCDSSLCATVRRRFLAAHDAASLADLGPLLLRQLASDTLYALEESGAAPPPEEPHEQLIEAIEAVCRSWTAPRAQEYRRITGIDAAASPAVLVQTMVFGNAHGASGSGVAFTRHPSTGANELIVDFLFNAQGEDVVSGRGAVAETDLLQAALPAVHRELCDARTILESEFRDMQDFEFTVENGTLYFLQTRAGKRTPWAALHIAVDLARDGVITPAEAVARVDNYKLDAIQRTRVDVPAGTRQLARGVSAGIGSAVGAAVFDADRARALAIDRPVVLVRTDLATDDIAAISVAQGVLTTCGSRTSHAAVVARHMGKVCVVGCAALRVDDAARRCMIGEQRIDEGDIITVDGNSGAVFAGEVPVVAETPDALLSQIQRWRSESSCRELAGSEVAAVNGVSQPAPMVT